MTTIVLAFAVVRVARTFAVEPVESRVSVSIPATVKVAAPVTFCKPIVAESAEPDTPLYVTVWPAVEVSRTVTPTEVEIPAKVKALEEPWLTTLVVPVALVRSKVAALVIAETETFSILVIEEGVTEPLITANISSVPNPPSRRSPEFKVCRLPVLRPASNVSSPVPPVNVFEPVVSGRI